MNAVLTTKGLVDLDRLHVVDRAEVGDNYRKVISSFYLDGELVKQDVAVSALRPFDLLGEQGKLNGQ